MSNDEIFESSLGFLMKQIDLHVESQKRVNKQSNKGSKNINTNKEESKLMVLD